MKKFLVVSPLFLLLLCCGGKKVATNAPTSTLDEPDRALYERAMRDLNKNKFTVARLTLQTLINTYPDSEYLPRAKYEMAESFYKENSSASLSQAENEFKDYITFFPATELADDAQMQIAMTHIRRIEKADRDRTQAMLAEIELKSMIDTYPDSDLLKEAKEKLRAVQEVLADGVNGIANQYMLRRNYAAAMSRYKEVVTKYPDYSKLSDTLFNMAEALRHVGNEQESAIYYARIVVEHPLSEKVEDAKNRLKAIDPSQPIPGPNPVALARAQQAANRDDRGMFGKVFGMFKSRPNVPTDSGAATTAEGVESDTDSAPAPVRGGNTGATGSSTGGNGGNGTFSIDPKAVDEKAQPAAKKPR